MTGLVLGTHCALCKNALEGDEGVGVPRKGRLLWMHYLCSRKFRQRLQKPKRKPKRRSRGSGSIRVGSPGRSGRVGALLFVPWLMGFASTSRRA